MKLPPKKEKTSTKLAKSLSSHDLTSQNLTSRARAAHLTKLGDKPLPLLRFADHCPVYFDRHTLSVKAGQLSMYTLDGRMRFALALKPADEANFKEKKLREIVLSRGMNSVFGLSFLFSDAQDGDSPEPTLPGNAEVPEYVMVEEAQLP